MIKDQEKSQKKQKKKNANPDDDIDKILAELKKDVNNCIFVHILKF
jgi:hypothetical protein